MSFKAVAVVAAVVTFALGVGYLAAGALVVGRWQIEASDSVLLLGRRLGALYVGLSVILFLARSTPVSRARTAICAGAVVICSLLAILGTYERAAGHAGPAILASVVLEALLALGFAAVLLGDRKAPAAVVRS